MAFKNKEQAKVWAKKLNSKYGLPMNDLLDDSAILLEEDSPTSSDKNAD